MVRPDVERERATLVGWLKSAWLHSREERAEVGEEGLQLCRRYHVTCSGKVRRCDIRTRLAQSIHFCLRHDRTQREISPRDVDWTTQPLDDRPSAGNRMC